MQGKSCSLFTKEEKLWLLLQHFPLPALEAIPLLVVNKEGPVSFRNLDISLMLDLIVNFQCLVEKCFSPFFRLDCQQKQQPFPSSLLISHKPGV